MGWKWSVLGSRKGRECGNSLRRPDLHLKKASGVIARLAGKYSNRSINEGYKIVLYFSFAHVFGCKIQAVENTMKHMLPEDTTIV